MMGKMMGKQMGKGKLFTLLLTGTLAFSWLSPALAQEQIALSSGNKPFVASVRYLVDSVPSDLFGHWQRTRSVVDTSAPQGFFGMNDEGLWTISRLGEKVFFLNPDNGVKVNIPITKVANDTATFAYDKQLPGGKWCHEELTLIPAYDRLSGMQSKTCYQRGADGRPEQYFFAVAEVAGHRATSLPPLPLK